MSKPMLLIDGDILIYSSIASVEHEVEFEDDLWVMWADARQAQEKFHEQLKFISDLVPDRKAYLCISDGTNFRYSVDPTYKGNRKNTRKPMGFLKHKQWVIDNHDTIIKPGIEADDTLGILMTKPGTDAVLWSGDKDLKQIPGQHLTKDGLITITTLDGDLWFYTQVLIGDPTDGYKGCPGIGKVKAEKILADATDTLISTIWPSIVSTYAKAGLTEADALQQARLARILRWDDWDGKEQKVKLWTP